jgi:hypothetical protein
MKIIPFKILILSILLPPLLYLLTVTSLENYLQKKYEKELTNIYLSDMDDILKGLTGVKDAIVNEVTDYLNDNIFLTLGGKIDVSVTTNQGNILYPSTYQNATFDTLSIDPARLAEKNFEILNEGIGLKTSVEIPHYSFLAIGVLLFYISIFSGGLFRYYRNLSAKIHYDDIQKNEKLNRLQELENERLKQIDQLSEERMLLLDEYDQLKSTFQKEKSQAEKTEEDLFEEIETLEKKLSEIEKLKIQIAELEKSKNHLSKQKEKSIEKLGKRFKTLYKNIELTHRALGALTNMTEDMSLKAEEIIHQLNSDPDLVSVKRKVFSKKGKTTSFEVVFAYNGRLYFRKTSGNQIKILTIGSKNTQAKDLMYLDNI